MGGFICRVDWGGQAACLEVGGGGRGRSGRQALRLGRLPRGPLQLILQRSNMLWLLKKTKEEMLYSTKAKHHHAQAAGATGNASHPQPCSVPDQSRMTQTKTSIRSACMHSS